ncbi:MAG TPA: hypothetical protein VHS96_09880 [Bacteroidia bacterium]|nr:hypothetical protein [Bacteroidia bacterium]
MSLAYFAYGTWRIDRTLTKVEEHLENINQEAAHISTIIDESPRDR